MSSAHDDNCSRCYANRKGRSNYAGHRFYRACRLDGGHAHHGRELWMKKPTKIGSAGSSPLVSRLSKTVATATVQEWMTDGRWEDGTARETSTLSLFFEDGVLKVAFHDRSQSRSLYLAGDCLETVLEALEVRLADGTGEWRLWKGKGNKRS